MQICGKAADSCLMVDIINYYSLGLYILPPLYYHTWLTTNGDQIKSKLTKTYRTTTQLTVLITDYSLNYALKDS